MVNPNKWKTGIMAILYILIIANTNGICTGKKKYSFLNKSDSDLHIYNIFCKESKDLNMFLVLQIWVILFLVLQIQSCIFLVLQIHKIPFLVLLYGASQTWNKKFTICNNFWLPKFVFLFYILKYAPDG